MARLLILAAVLGCLSFALLDTAGVCLVESRIGSGAYIKRMDEKYAAMLRDYTARESVSSMDTEKWNRWDEEHWEVDIQIFREGVLVYDSYYPGGELLSMEEKDIPGNAFPLTLVDGDAKAVFYGHYGYRLYTGALVFSLLLSFGIFLLAVMLGIRKTICYIGLLSDEIRGLEAGELDHPITVQGKDELAALAGGLDDMRRAFREQTRREAQMAEDYRRIITEMSHDLRTPLTALLIYTEVLNKRKFRDEGQMWTYIEKINKKAYQMKRMSDQIFEYALSRDREEPPVMEYAPFREAFYDLFSETESLLTEKGFTVEADLSWPGGRTWVCREYLTRILDNLVSNIEKYADRDVPVSIWLVCKEGYTGFLLENGKKDTGNDTESNRIGLRNIRGMMDKMGGRCMVDGEGEKFRMELLFRT